MSRRPICGDEVEETAAERSLVFYLTGEGRRGGDMRRRRRFPPSRVTGERKKGEGIVRVVLQKGPRIFVEWRIGSSQR